LGERVHRKKTGIRSDDFRASAEILQVGPAHGSPLPRIRPQATRRTPRQEVEPVVRRHSPVRLNIPHDLECLPRESKRIDEMTARAHGYLRSWVPTSAIPAPLVMRGTAGQP